MICVLVASLFMCILTKAFIQSSVMKEHQLSQGDKEAKGASIGEGRFVTSTAPTEMLDLWPHLRKEAVA